ncbi:fumarylacetoacetase [Aquincola sp. S2]|uniref:fumarylacetoacetase n=1 Tax=Pseudaquabacterium terrae TaxID=2732868 RepID=A0ABX2EPI4_9BURK|nr:fumarylacetoacetase [Aquabacterium terrae]NRF70561.1 fumarylacetoacetase [Aquabacterium terrae]
MLNTTHDPQLTSWVASANRPDADFPIQNLPHGVFRRRGSGEAWRGGVAIGDQVLDLGPAAALGLFDGLAAEAAALAAAPQLNGLMAAGPVAWSALRAALSQALRERAPQAARLRECLVPQADAEHTVPAQIGDFTDFLASYDHMVNAGRIFQPAHPELPNFRWLPIAYHGRSSSIDVSGTDFPRPLGQTRAPGAAAPSFGPSQRLDYELEIGAFVGPGNVRGRPIAVGDAQAHLFGIVLLNDWSARDLQAWEALPLGPFMAKNFLTTISPWIVTLEALAPFLCGLPRRAEAPEELPYLRLPPGREHAAFDIQLEVALQTATSAAPMPLTRRSARHFHWSLAQMLTHHASNGCNLRPGDLIGSGTQSGPNDDEKGCLLELSHGGQRPIRLPNGEERAFLEDGDTVVMRGWCERDGFARIGFGECRGTVLPSGAH